ncbi:sulfurtransferase [Microvirga alba]|uniref:Sulfurtransferase n=1 Tax=Microvirga alba TaxID=2791025 RepID=A0A931BP87_9HYPH|nr:sulfurtransferase [Microvirga alba]MBF9232214.1 sulfurtransferase [Microvirga alba]
MIGPLIAPDALETRLGASDLFVLDIRSTSEGGRQAFEAGHIPGSGHSDYETGGWRVAADGAAGLLPPADRLSDLFGRLGLRPDDAIVIVSAGRGASDLAAAARVYWTLKAARHPRVAVLDGGYRTWAADPSRAVETGPGIVKAATSYPVSYDDGVRSDLEQTLSSWRGKSATFIDARSASYFEGREKAPSAKVAGHIPGASAYDYTRVVDPETLRLFPKEKLAEQFARIGEGPVINYCNTGHTAALNWFVLSEILGRDDVRLFDGSMTQWTQDPSRPVATGPKS